MRDSDYYRDARHNDYDDHDGRARRLQLIVYSAMVAFVVLAVYGFWLITSLTRDVSRLAIEMSAMTRTIEREMAVMSAKVSAMDEQMVAINDNMGMMNQNMVIMSRNTDTMSANISVMTRDIGSMNQNIRAMSTDITTMAGSTFHMQRDMWSLNRNVSGPLGFMNMFNPMGGGQGPFPNTPIPYYPQHVMH